MRNALNNDRNAYKYGYHVFLDMVPEQRNFENRAERQSGVF